MAKPIRRIVGTQCRPAFPEARGDAQAQAAPRPQNGEAVRAKNAASAANKPGHLDISKGTAAIHPNTGIRKAHSVGCTQSMEHSSGMWYDGREMNSGTLEDLEFEPVDSPCEGAASLYMCYYGGELYADSEAVYSDEDEDEDEEPFYDDDDDEDEDEDDVDDEDSDSPDDVLYMKDLADSSHKGMVAAAAADRGGKMSSPVDARDLHSRLVLVQGQDCSA